MKTETAVMLDYNEMVASMVILENVTRHSVECLCWIG